MATVHLARDSKHVRDVAIKGLHPGLDAARASERMAIDVTLDWIVGVWAQLGVVTE